MKRLCLQSHLSVNNGALELIWCFSSSKSFVPITNLSLLYSSQVKSTITVDQNIRGPRSPYNMTSLVPITMPPNTNPFKGNQSSRVFLSQNRGCLCWFQNYSSQKGENRGYILAGPKLNTCRSLSTLSCYRALLYFTFIFIN